MNSLTISYHAWSTSARLISLAWNYTFQEQANPDKIVMSMEGGRVRIRCTNLVWCWCPMCKRDVPGCLIDLKTASAAAVDAHNQSWSWRWSQEYHSLHDAPLPAEALLRYQNYFPRCLTSVFEIGILTFTTQWKARSNTLWEFCFLESHRSDHRHICVSRWHALLLECKSLTHHHNLFNQASPARTTSVLGE